MMLRVPTWILHHIVYVVGTITAVLIIRIRLGDIADNLSPGEIFREMFKI